MQQVNLYLPELRPRREWLSAEFAVLACVGFIALLLIAQLVTTYRANSLDEQITGQEARVATLEAQVARLKQASTAAGTPSLDETIAQLETAIANRQKVGRILAGQNVGNARGFHANLQALAQQSQDDLALERFTFSRGGGYVEMRGQARSATAVPLYLQRLKQSAAFGQARFGLLSVTSENSSGSVVEFALGYDNIYAQKPAGGKR